MFISCNISIHCSFSYNQWKRKSLAATVKQLIKRLCTLVVRNAREKVQKKGASYFDSKQHNRMHVQVHAHCFCIICSYASKTKKHLKFSKTLQRQSRGFYSISRVPNICLHSSTCCRTEIKGRFSLYQRCKNYFPKLQSDTVFRSCQGRFTVHCRSLPGCRWLLKLMFRVKLLEITAMTPT